MAMTPIEIDSDTIMQQAIMTAGDYLRRAVLSIDNEFGEGFAKKNTNLIGAFMAAAASDFKATLLAQRVEHLAESISNSIDGISMQMMDALTD